MSNRGSRTKATKKATRKATKLIFAGGKSWTLPVILGLALGVAGVVFTAYQLRPQMVVDHQEPLEANNPMSSPFSVQNTGYFSFWVEDAHCWALKVKVAGATITNGSWDSVAYHNHYLDRANSTTVFCKIVDAPTLPTEADIQIVVRYKPWHFFPMTFDKVFRFVGRYGDHWEWTKEEPVL
jgi:hypothetical protein